MWFRVWEDVVHRIYLLLIVSVGCVAPLGAAQAMCFENDRQYSPGATICLPAPNGGVVTKKLYVCEGDAWRAEDAACPEEFRYFCAVGPYSVRTGERLLIGAGPLELECKFPGEFALVQPNPSTPPIAPTTPVGSDAGRGPGTPSRTVRAVQTFLSSEEAGEVLNCAADACSGLPDPETIAAALSYLRDNIENLAVEERKAFGFNTEADVGDSAGAANPIDFFPLFARTFDVPLNRR